MINESISIIKKLQESGHQAYWVGGCVRDILLGKKPNDYDIVTSANPKEIEKILKNYNLISVGRQFGVIIAVIDKTHFEIATFRSEKEYSDARRPDKVFWASAEKDAERRDFTINGLFLDPLTKERIDQWQLPGIRQMKNTKYGLVIDYIGGIKDLDEKTIRFIGNANERINEDHLRILRAIRFKNTFGFKYNNQTFNAIKENAEKIKTISSERIKDELNKMLSHESRYNSLIDLEETWVMRYCLPEISKLKGVPQPDIYHKEGDVLKHTLLAVKSLPPKSALTLIWSVLLHDSGKPATISFPKSKNDRIRFNKHVKYSAGIASQVCRHLKFPNSERNLIVWLVKNHMILGDIPRMKLAKQRLWLMDSRFAWLLKLNKADAMGSKPLDLKLYEKNLALYNKAKELYEEEKKRPKFKPLISGNDLIREFKFEPGPKIGKMLELARDAQLEGKVKNKSDALELIKSKLSS